MAAQIPRTGSQKDLPLPSHSPYRLIRYRALRKRLKFANIYLYPENILKKVDLIKLKTIKVVDLNPYNLIQTHKKD
ncbi:MAG: hypothetical protein ACI8V8_002518 [Chitinophagales bacterium]|jgi:hypothetical protein